MCGLALIVPAGVLGYWLTRSVAGAADWDAIAGAAGHSLLAGGLAALAAAACASPSRCSPCASRGAASTLVERASYAGHALPGIVVGLALVFFGTRVALPLYQTLAMLVAAFVVLFLPQAVAPARASLLQVPAAPGGGGPGPRAPPADGAAHDHRAAGGGRRAGRRARSCS